MKTKSKLITVVLIGCALVLAFTACAGCTGGDSDSTTNNAKPIVGTYVTSILGIGMILDFHSDFTVDIIGTGLDGTVTKDTRIYKGHGDNEYYAEDMVIQLSDDANVVAVTGLDEGGVLTFNKFSNYKIPTPSPTAAPTPTPTPVPVIKSGSVGNFVPGTYGGKSCNWGIPECIRGEKANQLVAEGSKNNKVPEPGYEYVLCRYLVDRGNDNPITLDGTTPFIVMANGKIAESPIVSLPREYQRFGKIDNYVYAYEGWLAYIVPTSSTVKVYLADSPSSLEDKAYIKL